MTAPIINHLGRAGTSVGANYRNADEAESKRDFRHTIAICRKEAKATKFWLRMIAKAAPVTENSRKYSLAGNETTPSDFLLSHQQTRSEHQQRAPHLMTRYSTILGHWSLDLGPSLPV